MQLRGATCIMVMYCRCDNEITRTNFFLNFILAVPVLEFTLEPLCQQAQF